MNSRNNPIVTIRAYTVSDRNALRKICADTAFMGEPVERFLKNRKLFADWTTLYYTDYEPKSIFLAECGNKVVGYIMGSMDEKGGKAIFWQKVVPRLLASLLPSLGGSYRDSLLLFHLIKSFLKGEFKRPDFSSMYPAHLHINVDRDFRGLGIGLLLMHRFLEHLVFCGIKAVRLSSISKKAYHFFEKSGFTLLSEQKVTYFDHILNEPLSVRMYGKILMR